MSPPRESYARAWVVKGGLEFSLGLEYDDEEEAEELSAWLKNLGENALEHETRVSVVSYAEQIIRTSRPGRAYFIETERENKGVQIYQPYGLPRNP